MTPSAKSELIFVASLESDAAPVKVEKLSLAHDFVPSFFSEAEIPLVKFQ